MGRPVGSHNKNKSFLMNVLKEKFPEYEPVVEMAKIACDMGNDVNVRLNANKEVAKYIHPQLKAIELKGDEDSPVTLRGITINLVKSSE